MWDQFSNSQICLRFRLSIVLEMFSSNYLPTVCCLVIHLILENCWFIEFLRLARYYSHIHLNDKTHLECFMPQIGSWCICDQSNHKQILIIDIVKLCCVDDMSILYQFCLYSTQFVYFEGTLTLAYDNRYFNKEWNLRHSVKDFWVFENWKRSSVLVFFFKSMTP